MNARTRSIAAPPDWLQAVVRISCSVCVGWVVVSTAAQERVVEHVGLFDSANLEYDFMMGIYMGPAAVVALASTAVLLCGWMFGRWSPGPLRGWGKGLLAFGLLSVASAVFNL